MEFTEQSGLQIYHRKTFALIGLACFAILAVSSVLQLGAQYLTSYYAPQWIDQAWYLWVMTFLPLYGVGVPVGIILFKRIPVYQAGPRKLRFKDLLLFLIMCFPMMYIGNIIGTLLNNALHMLLGTEIRNPLDSYMDGTNIWLTVLFLVLLAPLIEEFIFRKLIIDRVRPYGEGACVLISALLFGLFHGNLNQFFYAFGIGAIFAFIYIKTGRLRYPIFMHMTINLLGGVLAPALLKGMDLNALTEMSRTDPNALMRYAAEHLPQLLAFSLYSILNFSLVIAGFVLLIIRRRAFFFEHGAMRLQKGTGFKTVFLNYGMILFALGALALFVFSLL